MPASHRTIEIPDVMFDVRFGSGTKELTAAPQPPGNRLVLIPVLLLGILVCICRQRRAQVKSLCYEDVVMRRNTSSRRPRSTEISSAVMPLARKLALTSSTMVRPPLGTAKNRADPLVCATASRPSRRKAASPRQRGRTVAAAAPTEIIHGVMMLGFGEQRLGVPSKTMRPCAMMTAREHTASTSSRRCVEMTMPFPAPCA